MRFLKTFWFELFLTGYTVLLFFHLFSFDWKSPLIILSFAAGLVFAIVAHASKSSAVIWLLVIHMAIEWYEYGATGFRFSSETAWFYVLHTLFDITFLCEELWEHVKSAYLRIGIAVLIFFILMFAYMFAGSHGPLPIASGGIELFVLGGIVGCTLSHLVSRLVPKITLPQPR